MSAQPFTEYPFNYHVNDLCFYCGEGFAQEDVFVQWRGYARETDRDPYPAVNVHEDCAKDLAIHLASDHLKAKYHPVKRERRKAGGS